MTDKLQIYLNEYTVLKEEQKSRIGFRDNLLYVNLAAVGTTISYSLTKPENKYALLVLPLVCLVLGWTYLMNDQKISAIGKYIRGTLSAKVTQLIDSSTNPEDFFAWEEFHRSNNFFAQGFRKLQQWIIDEITFIGSGVLGLVLFRGYLANELPVFNTIWWIELFLLIILGLEMLIYAVLAWVK